MKANEVPEKIYADPEVFSISDELNDLLQTKEEGRIEYTRTDAFLEDEHWKDVRERAAIAAMQGIINHGEMPDILIARAAVRYADELVKQLKGE